MFSSTVLIIEPIEFMNFIRCTILERITLIERVINLHLISLKEFKNIQSTRTFYNILYFQVAK